MRIFLVGFMGAGKSYIGSRLAARLGMDFIDLDEAIINKAQKSIADIFAADGEIAFRILESDVLRECGERKDLLIASGGGTPCFFNNMDWMNANGLTLFLDASVPCLIQRLQPETAKRPLLAGKTSAELAIFLQEKLEERRPFYEQAQLTFPQEIDSENSLEVLEAAIRKRMED